MIEYLRVWFGPVVYSLFVGLALSLFDRREKSYTPKGDAPLYSRPILLYYISPVAFFLPLSLLLYLVDSQFFLHYWSTVGLLFTVYLSVFLLLMPLLRRFMQASSCAAFWSVLLIQLRFMCNDPKWTIQLPFAAPSGRVMAAVFWIWLCGYIATLLWHIAGHFIFRRRLLKHATPLDGNEHALFQKWLQITNFPAGYLHAVRSPAAKTPVSIGLFWKTTCVVLPAKDYTPEELALIFHHEIVHISRSDSVLKFLMVTFASLFWFHPLAWIALKRCAADLELSCDEAVMYGRPKEMRQQYASLLLETADRSPGFTSCLSASAGALRYRLKNIVRPKKRIVGAVLVSVLCFSLAVLSTTTCVRFAPALTKEQIFPGEDLSQMQIMNVTFKHGGTGNYANHTDPAILEYIAELSVSTDELTGSFVHPPDELWVLFELKSPQHIYRIRLWDNYLTVSTFDQDPDTGTFHANDDFTRYHLEAPPDWEYIFSCILPDDYLLGQS